MYFDLLEETGNGKMFASRLDFLVQTLSTLAVIPFPFFLSLQITIVIILHASLHHIRGCLTCHQNCRFLSD